MKVSAAALTDVGAKRTNNEDAFSICEDLDLYIVADGMGGHMSGEIASRLAVESIRDFFRTMSGEGESTWPYPYDDSISFTGNKLVTSMAVANEKIQSYAAEHPESKGMGTTVVSAVNEEAKLLVAYVGDSRAYLYREGGLTLLTSDHSWVNEQVRLGFLSEREAERHPFRNVITRALGTKGDVRPDIEEVDLKVGDILMLCTDGLNTMVQEEEMLHIFADEDDLGELCRKLVQRANQRGGEDNVTVLLLRRVE